MTYISITDFEILSTPISDETIYLKFYINKSNFITFPFYIKNIETEIIEKFNKILNGKEVVINLKLEDSENENKLLQVKKEYILFDIIKRYEQSIIQETYLIFENNSIFRNAIRKFIIDYKNPISIDSL
jgi:hypothetical protein